MNPKLTIGMCTYDDFHGVYFSVMALRMYHSEIMDETEIIIIDNNPNSPHGKELKNFKGWIKNLRYIPYSETVGPANSKNQVFKNAKAPYVLCMDGHVMFENGSLKKLLDMYKSDPTTETPNNLNRTTDDDADVNGLNDCLTGIISTMAAGDQNILRAIDLNRTRQIDFATQNNLALPTVKSRIQRARKRLRNRMIACCPDGGMSTCERTCITATSCAAD